MHPACEELVEEVSASRRNWLRGAVVFLVLTMIATAQWPELRGIAYVGLGITALFLLLWYTTRPDRLRDVLLLRADHIAWFYADPRRQLLDGVPAVGRIDICICLVDGSRLSACVPGTRFNAVMEGLAHVAPGAVVGYTSDTERDFFSFVGERRKLLSRGESASFAEWRRNPLAFRTRRLG